MKKKCCYLDDDSCFGCVRRLNAKSDYYIPSEAEKTVSLRTTKSVPPGLEINSLLSCRES